MDMKMVHGAALAVVLAAMPAAVQPAHGQTLASLLTGSRLDEAAVAALYRQAVLRDAVPALEAEVAVAAERRDAAPRQRTMAYLTAALITWQDGRIDAAVVAADAALALAPGSDTWLMRARLFDAMGRPARAAPLYAQAAEAARDPAERAALRLRAAIAANDVDTSPIAALATGAGPRERRGIAELLGVLGNPAAALATYRTVADGVPGFSAQVRMAQWAIAARDRGAATTATWSAYRAATTPADRRYTLALLAEAFRNPRDLVGLLTFLTDKPAAPDVVQLRVDTLVELGRFDDALAVLRRSGDPDLAAQLPGLLDLAGRREALVAEYDRRIARQPASLRWYDALAVLYMSAGDRTRALGVFRRLFAANGGNLPLLTDAARRMIAMGLTEPALAMIGESGVGRTTAIGFFQFESEAAQGQTEAAVAVLADLERRLPLRDPQRIAMADGYERLGRGGDALRVLMALEATGYAFSFDDQLHLARLERESGRDAAVLARLRTLWFGTSLPAQRGFIETQILSAARRLDRIDAVSDEVRARIAAGDDRGVELLVALRLVRNDAAGAGAAVDGFAKAAGTSPDRLKRLAGLYQKLRDSSHYRATLTRLAAADPVNAATYLQQLVRDVAVRPARGVQADVPAGELEALLTRLTAVRRSSPAEARRFAAGVYAVAGKADRAIALYRQALASAPADQDATLGLVNLLNANGRRVQAIALLQYRAEFAATPAAQAQALDALAGILAATSGGAEAEQSPEYAAARLFWARRWLYWRLARGGSDAALYDQLADLSEQIGDTRTQRRAREAALAVEGTQRAATLRQLIALSSGAGEGGSTAAVGDNDGKALYGRRLTALRQPYPADVYAELAAAMLAQHDLAGAERAFGLIEDIPGLVNIDAMRGDAYLAAGYLPRALAGYSRGLLRESGDRGLILKTAILQEQVGDPAIARDLYRRSLQDALLRLPVTGPPAPAAPFDDSVLEGLLFAWPTDADARRDLAATIVRMTQDALPADTPAGWSRAIRARRLLDIARRAAAGGLDTGILAAVDPLFATRFGNDRDYVREHAAYRDLTSEPRAAAPAPTGGADWIGDALRVQANDGANAELRLSLALARGDDAELTRLFDAAAQAEVAKRRELGATDFVYASPLNAMLMMAATQLTAAQVRDVVLAPLDRAELREDTLFNLFRTAPDRLALLERTVGAPLLSDDRLIALLRTRFNAPTPRRETLRRRGGIPPDLPAVQTARFSADQQVTLYAGLVEDALRTGSSSALLPPLEQRILRQPLAAATQSRMAAAIQQAMGTQTLVMSLAQRIVSLLDVPTDNRPVVIAAARAFAKKYPEEGALPAAIEAYFRSDRAAALEILLRRYDDTPQNERGESYVPAAISRYLAEDYRHGGDAFVALANPGREAQALFYRRYVQVVPSSFGGKDDDRQRYLERLTTLDPDNAAYLAGLLDQYWNANDRAGFVGRLAAFVAAHPEERDAASVLQLAQLLAGQGDAAATVAARSRVDVQDPDYLTDLLARVQAGRGNGTGGASFLAIFGYVYEAGRREKPTLPGIAALEARRRKDRTVAQPVAADLFDPVMRVAADPAGVPVAMRGVWRRSAADPVAPDDSAAAKRGLLLYRLTNIGNAPAGQSEDAAIAATLTASPAILAEMERELLLLDPYVRQQQQPVYDLIVAGTIRLGAANGRIDALLGRLADGSIDAHELQLLATLALRSGRVLRAAELAGLRHAVDRLPAMSAQRRIVWSQLYARSGDYAAARQWLEAAAMQILYIDVGELGGGAKLATFDTLVAALRTWPDQVAAAAAHAALAARIERERAIMPADDVPAPLPPLAPAA